MHDMIINHVNNNMIFPNQMKYGKRRVHEDLQMRRKPWGRVTLSVMLRRL